MPKVETPLDLQAAADEIGVHYQTAYRWVRDGRLRAHVVDGRYQIARGDLDTFVASRRTPRRPSAPSSKRLATAATTMYDALVAGDEAGALALARSIAVDGTPLKDVIQLVLAPALRRIGEEWHAGRVSVWQEHRASAITERILGDIARNPRGRRRGSVMVAAVEGDRHSLATTMATVVLRDQNWIVHHLGADIPAAELIDFCRDHHVDAAVLTVTNSSVVRDAHDLARQLDDDGTPTLVGGPGRTLEDLLDGVAALVRPSPDDRSGH